MSTLGSVMNSALKSMTANQLALAVASNNIANAGTPGYTRQRLVTAPSVMDERNPSIGTGVDVIRVQALRDSMVESRLRQEISAKSGDGALTQTLGDVEVLFNDTNTDQPGLLKYITDFFNSFQTLSLDPASLNFREQLKISAQALIDSFQSHNRDLKNIQNQADASITSQVDQVNLLTKQIATISAEISRQEIDGQAANDLRDRRSDLVGQLSEFMAVNELESGGNYQLSTKDNQLLVFNGVQRPLTVNDITSNIGDGSLKAKVDLRDTYIPKYLNALDQLAYEITQQVNTIHSGGYDLDGDTGVGFFGTLASAADASRLIGLSASVQSDVRNIAASGLATGSDNQVAMQIGNLLHTAVFTGGSVTDQYGALVFSVGSDLSTAQLNLNQHDSMVSQLQNRRQSISGVSVDEETAKILQFQRSFEASSRLIRTVDELLQTTIAMVGN